jgi:hypothetical protein
VAPPASPDGVSERIGGAAGLVIVGLGLLVLAVAQAVIVRRARRDNAVTPAMLDATFSVRPGGDAGATAAGSLPLVTPGDLHAVGDVLDTKQGFGVAGGELALADVGLKLVVESEETDAVGDAGARLAETIGDGFLRETEVTHERSEAEGFVDGVEVGALQILDERELEHLQIGGDSLNHRHFGQARQSCSPPSAFTGDQLEKVAHHPHHQGLDNALLADRIG